MLDSLFGDSAVIRRDLADLVERDVSTARNGCAAYVISENETYRLDLANSFAPYSPLIISRTVGPGRWFRRSKQYVVGNYTMWVVPFSAPSSGLDPHTLNGYTPGQLLTSSSAAPDILLDLSAVIPNTSSIFDVVVDGSNNVWLATFRSNHSSAVGTSYKFALSSLLQSGAPTPTVILNEPPGSVAASVWATQSFDKQNNLWVAFPTHGGTGIATMLKYGQPSYAISGAPVPDITITLQATPASPDSGFFTFDAQGNLWLAVGVPIVGVTGLRMISNTQLLSSAAALVPAVNWSGALWDAQNPQGMAFGPDGNLWVADFAGNTLKSYSTRSPVSGNQAPILTITSPGNLNGPDGIVFDASGNLWVGNDNDNKNMKFAASDLTSSGAKTPTVVLRPPTFVFGNMMAFANNPQRSGLTASGSQIGTGPI